MDETVADGWGPDAELEPDAFDEGRVLGDRFVLGRRIGRGGMGEVYEATDGETGRPVAEKVLRKSKHRKRMLLAKVKRERELYKNMISELKASARKLRKMIEEAEKARYALKGFSKMKRRLPWPVEGRLALPYGSYRDPKFKTPVFRNGIHIRAKEGDIVRSVYPGKVVFADWFKGYGKVVIVNHGEGYYTVYANLSEIFLSKGDIINKGDEIGRVGESGTLSAPALYFEVRYKGKPLNPLHWLKRKKG